jgi:hypothetical protein
MGATIRLEGEGGVVHTFDWPLRETYVDQVKLGKLLPADDAAREFLATVDGAPPAATPADVERPLSEPPRGGPGATRDAWAAYAYAHDVDVDDDMSRDDIIVACDDAGVVDG